MNENKVQNNSENISDQQNNYGDIANRIIKQDQAVAKKINEEPGLAEKFSYEKSSTSRQGSTKNKECLNSSNCDINELLSQFKNSSNSPGGIFLKYLVPPSILSYIFFS